MKILCHSFHRVRLTFLSLLILVMATNSYSQKVIQPVLGYRNAEILKIGNLEFKDLNKNHKLDNYEDWRLPVDE